MPNFDSQVGIKRPSVQKSQNPKFQNCHAPPCSVHVIGCIYCTCRWHSFICARRRPKKHSRLFFLHSAQLYNYVSRYFNIHQVAILAMHIKFKLSISWRMLFTCMRTRISIIFIYKYSHYLFNFNYQQFVIDTCYLHILFLHYNSIVFSMCYKTTPNIFSLCLESLLCVKGSLIFNTCRDARLYILILLFIQKILYFVIYNNNKFISMVKYIIQQNCVIIFPL